MACDNVRATVVELPSPTDPNFKSSAIVTQKVYPVSSIIDATNAISGNLQFEWTVPSGYRQLMDRTYIVFDLGMAVALGTALVTSAPAPNLCASAFTTGRFEIQDYLVAQSNNVAQDDTLMKRMINSKVKNNTTNSCSYFYGSDTERFDAWQTYLRQTVAWQPDCLINREQILPSNVKCRMILQVNPNVNTPANNPMTVDKTDAAGDCVSKFYSIYMVNTFVKVDSPLPQTVYIPAYSINSSYQIVSGTNWNAQWSIPKDAYKVVIAFQSNSATVRAGQRLTKFCSGVLFGAQNSQSLLLTSLQMRYGSQTYPSTPYTITESATQKGSIEPYCQYLNDVEAQLDQAGAESYNDWSDPVVLADAGLGRLFSFSLVKPSNSTSTTAEVTTSWSGAPANTRCILFSITKTAIGITYGANGQVMDIKSIPYQ